MTRLYKESSFKNFDHLLPLKMGKLLYSILLIRICLTTTSGLTVDRDTKIDDIPAEYSQYIRQIGGGIPIIATPSTLTTTPSISPDQELVQAPLPPPFNYLPGVQLCKEKPAEGDLYGQIFCWALLGLYLMLIISLIIYQLRSIYWIKSSIKRQDTPSSSNNQQGKRIEIELGPYGRGTTF